MGLTTLSNYDLVCNRLNTMGLKKMVSYNASAANTYEVLSDSKITIPAGKYLRMTATGIWRNTYITEIRIQRGNDVENAHTLAINENNTGYNGLPVTTTYYNDSASGVDIYVAAKANGTTNTMIAIVYDFI